MRGEEAVMIRAFPSRFLVVFLLGVALTVAVYAYGGFFPAIIPAVLFGCLTLFCFTVAVFIGIPVEFVTLLPHQELILFRRIDPNLSLVKTARGDEIRLVRGIPFHLAEGETFIPRCNGTVVIVKQVGD